jgi:hypothetical protein
MNISGLLLTLFKETMKNQKNKKSKIWQVIDLFSSLLEIGEAIWAFIIIILVVLAFLWMFVFG